MKKHRKSFTDWTGKRVGRLTVIKEMPRPEGQCQTLWHVRCDCGNEKFGVHSASLKSGKSTSCGCYRKEVMAYMGPPERQKSRSNPIYSTWASMIQRCTNSRLASWRYYGGRGIRVCQRWMESFDAFVDDMHPRPEKHSIDRIDVNGDYSPENCRWATAIQQAQNKQDTVSYEWNSEELCLKEICRRENVCFDHVRKQMRAGMLIYEAVRTSRHKPFKETAKHLGAPARVSKEQIVKCGSIIKPPVIDPAYHRIAKAIQWCQNRGIKYHGKPLPSDYQPTP